MSDTAVRTPERRRAAALVPSLDARAADDIWAEAPDAVIAAGYLASGNAERAPGGRRLLGCMLPMADSAKIPYLCLVPREDVEIDDNWHVMGLEATGCSAPPAPRASSTTTSRSENSAPCAPPTFISPSTGTWPEPPMAGCRSGSIRSRR